MKKIAVIGAGIAGTTTAYALLKKGHSVTIIDSRRYPAMATSYANGGQLDRKSTRLNSSHSQQSRMPSSA